ncbi:MAG TPA: lipocalin family protein [Desulfobacterales bacterium]
MRSIPTLFLVLGLIGCVGLPEGIEPVDGFDLNRYLGTWYEIARLDHSFERGLSRVTAHYSRREDGGLRVINRGFAEAENRWKEVEGQAEFVRDSNEGYLTVSFFGPFYGSYVIFELDREDYRYAFVSGPDKSYLWFLARTPEVSEEMTDRFVQRARALGFNTANLIFVKHAE